MCSQVFLRYYVVGKGLDMGRNRLCGRERSSRVTQREAQPINPIYLAYKHHSQSIL